MGLGDFVSGLTNAAEDGVSYVYHGVAGGENRADSRSRQDEYERAQQQGNAARDKIYAEQHRLQREIPAGTDPTSIDGKDNWDSWSHKAIKSMTDNLNSGQIHAAARGWSSVGGKVATDVADFQNVMKQTIGANWEGDAATEAQQSASAYSQQAEGFGHAIDLTGTKVSEAATGAEQTRNMMPPPKNFSFREAAISSLANPIAGANDIFQQKQAQNTAHAEAVRVMNTVYTPVYVQSDSGVPTFTAPTAMPGTGVAPAPSPPPVVAAPLPPPSTRPPVGPDQRGGPGAGGNNGQWSSPAGVNAPGDHTPSGSVAGAGAAGTDGPDSSVGGPGHGGPVYPGDGGRAGAGAGSNSPGAGVAAGGSPGDGTGDGGYSGADTGGFGNVAASNFAPDPTMSPGSLGGPAGGSAGGYGAGGYGAGGYGAGGYGAGGYGTGGYGAGSGVGTGALGAIGYGAGRAAGYEGASFGPSGSGGSAGYGSGAAGSAGGNAGGGAMGRGATSGVGSSPGAAAEAGAARGAGGSTSSGGRGAGGMGGMGGGRGKGDDDYEHNTPSYLITQEHGSEIVGELPLVSPPVIGE